MSKTTLVGLHIPKCAGSSLLAMATSGLQRNEVYQSTALFQNWVQENPDFMEIRDYSRLKFVWGHWIHEQMLRMVDNPFLFTGLREPRSRLLSEYNFQVGLRLELGLDIQTPEEWLPNQRDRVCHFIVNRFPHLAEGNNLFERAKNALNCFHYIYFSENFSESSRYLLSILGIKTSEMKKNEGPKKNITFDISDEIVANDVKLYEWAKEKFLKKAPMSHSYHNPSMESFLNNKPDRSILTDFLLHAQAEELKNFGVLGKAIETMKAQLAYKKRAIKIMQEYG